MKKKLHFLKMSFDNKNGLIMEAIDSIGQCKSLAMKMNMSSCSRQVDVDYIENKISRSCFNNSSSNIH